jgi:ADP-ribosyl-[dinitrogen reductase] hydrolase
LKLPWAHCYWVEPGRLLAGEHPGGDSVSQLRLHLAQLQAAGIDAFVDLTEPGERGDYVALLPPTVLYQRYPLVDHAAPEDDAPMRAIMTGLQTLLRDGRRVYVHCRAGIGRTGMVVGCYLVEQGRSGRQALEQLNMLWRQNALSRLWPRVPESEDQDQVIIGWRALQVLATPVIEPSIALPSAAPLRSASGLQDRARGAVWGLAMGDALSASSQTLQPGEFAEITAPVGGGVLQLAAGEGSDDTAMVWCVADSLLACRDIEPRDQIGRYQAWLAAGPAPGARPVVRKAIALASWRRGGLAGSHDPAQQSPEALGRCVTAVLFAHDDAAAAISAAAAITRVTHQAPLVVDACRLFAAMVHVALQGVAKAQLVTRAAQAPMAPLKAELLDLAQTWLPGTQPPPLVQGTVLAVLDAAVRAFLDHPDFASGLLSLVNQGGDSDVAGAAYGQLAGAHYGAAALPSAWLSTLSDLESLGAMADQLLTCREVSLQ